MSFIAGHAIKVATFGFVLTKALNLSPPLNCGRDVF
jgi:hypothetical protein